jgi:hypothetical protein
VAKIGNGMIKPLLFSLLFFLFAFVFLSNQDLRENFLRGTQIARGLLPEWDPDDMAGNFQRGMVKAKALSDLGFYEGWETLATEITREGDTIQVRRRSEVVQPGRPFPGLNSVLDTTKLIASLKKEGHWNSSWARRLRYVEKYYHLAVDEMLVSGIPASVTLAQAICESNSGRGTLARKANNHFGVKCRLKKNSLSKWEEENYFAGSLGCGCFQQEDDHKWDHFRMYCGDTGVDESFRDHTLVLQNPRYKKLFRYQVSDTLYPLDKSWFGVEAVPYYAGAAAMLKAGGYATAPDYHWTVAGIIDRLQLWRIDFAVISLF